MAHHAGGHFRHRHISRFWEKTDIVLAGKRTILLGCPGILAFSGYHRGVSNRAWSSKSGNRFLPAGRPSSSNSTSRSGSTKRAARLESNGGICGTAGIHAGQQAAHSRESLDDHRREGRERVMAVFSKEFPW